MIPFGIQRGFYRYVTKAIPVISYLMVLHCIKFCRRRIVLLISLLYQIIYVRCWFLLNESLSYSVLHFLDCRNILKVFHVPYKTVLMPALSSSDNFFLILSISSECCLFEFFRIKTPTFFPVLPLLLGFHVICV